MAALPRGTTRSPSLSEGLAAAREPRAAAEEFRQLLSEQLEKLRRGKGHLSATSEDLDTAVNLSGVSTPSARFILSVTFNPKPGDAARNRRAPAMRLQKSK